MSVPLSHSVLSQASDPKNLAIDELKINYHKPSKPPRATLKMPARSDISPAIIGPIESTKTSGCFAGMTSVALRNYASLSSAAASALTALSAAS